MSSTRWSISTKWLVAPAWGLLFAVAFGPLCGRLLGVYAPWGLWTAVGLTLAWWAKGTPKISSETGACTLSDLIAVLTPLTLMVWMLRSGDHDDPFCHHTFVALIDRWSLPAPSAGAPWREAAYHTAADGLASAIGVWLPWPAETRLDLVSIAAHFALALLALSIMIRLHVAPVARAFALVTLILGAGPYWLCMWWPHAQPSGFGWTEAWEAGTAMSTLSLAGRRSSVLGLLGCGLALLQLVSIRPKTESPWRHGLLWGGLLCAQLQAADECVVFCLVALSCWLQAKGGRAKTLVAIATPVALSISLSGGFLASWLLGQTSQTIAPEAAARGVELSLIWPQWPSFLGPNPDVLSVDGLLLFMWEIAPGALGLGWLVSRGRMTQHSRWTLVIWAMLGLIGATMLRAPRLGYDVDLHRLLQPSWLIGLVALPIWAHSLKQGRGLALLGCTALWVGPIGRGLQEPGILPVTAALVLACVMVVVALFERRVSTGGKTGRVAFALGLCICSWIVSELGPRDSDPRPPLLPELAVSELEPLLVDSTFAQTALLNGLPIYAPWYRDDVEPIDACHHDSRLGKVSLADLRRDGVEHFLLSPTFYEALNRTLGGRLHVERRISGVPYIKRWPSHGVSSSGVAFWGRVVSTARAGP